MEIAQNDQSAILLIDPTSGIIIEANKQSESLLEKKNKEIIGLKIDQLLFNEQNKKSRRFLKKINQKKAQSIYLLRNDGDGRIKHLGIKTSKFHINNRNLMKCTVHEVTQRFRIEDFLLGTSSKNIKLEEIINQGPIVIFLCLNKENWPLIYISENFSRFGYTSNEIRSGKINCMDLLHPDDLKHFKFNETQLNSLRSNDIRMKCRILTKSGEIKWVILHIWARKDLNGVITHWLGILLDITKRKLSEQKLKESEERFKILYENIAEGTFIIGSDYVIKDINDRTSHITGYKKDELIGQKCDIVCPNGSDSKKCLIWEKGQEEFKGMNTAIKCKDGRLNPIIKNAKKINLEGKIYILENFQDIAERKLVEQKLKTSEENYRELVRNANSIILKWDTNGKIIYMNEFGLKFFGYTNSELLGHHVVGTIVPETETSGRDLTFLIENICQNPDNYERNENENITKNGRKVWISWSNKAMKDDQGNLIGILSIGNDMTDRKIAEEKLIESEIKYRLAYNNADFYKDLFTHDMTNILHNILSSIELYSLCQKYPEKLDKGEDLLEIIKNQANRGSNLISNVHKLSKLEETEITIQKVEMLTYLKKSFKFVKDSFRRRKIDIILDTETEDLYVLANELILDVFENLLMNSVKYNNNPSVLIHIKISKEIRDNINYIKLEFIDNGIGVPDFRKDTIFQRSFNKDRCINGMGIGLSLVRKILYSYHGHITVEDNEKGDYTKGSNFIIYIPEAE